MTNWSITQENAADAFTMEYFSRNQQNAFFDLRRKATFSERERLLNLLHSFGEYRSVLQLRKMFGMTTATLRTKKSGKEERFRA